MLISRQTGFKNGNALSTQALVVALPNNTPLEFHVLLSTCRVFLGTEETAKLEALLQQEPDWDQLVSLANRHGVMPMFYRSISQNCPQAVPAEWLARLRMQYMMNAARNMKMTAELLRILDVLKGAGIKAVPLKGPMLAQQLYGDVALRQFSDLDILVAREDANKALIVLEEKGYRIADDPRKEKSEKKRAALLKWMYHYELTNANVGTHIELHWQLSPSLRRLNADEIVIWERAKIIGFSGKEILSLSDEDYLVFLCQHGARHLWKRLSWLCDVSALIINNVSCSSALEIARDAKNENVFLLGILLANGLIDVPAPEHIIQVIKFDGDLINLSNKIISGIISSQDVQDDSFRVVADLVLYKNVLSFQEKVAFYYELCTAPTKPDFDFVTLPDVLFPAYKLIRPVRLMKIYGKAFKKQFKESQKGE
jgi:hypothetical protein